MICWRLVTKSLLSAVLLLLSACSILQTGSYQAPQPELPEHWRAETEQFVAAEPLTEFWLSFQDPVLNRLIRQLLEKNNDLQVASIKVQRARLEAGLAQTDFYPTPSLSADVSRQRDLDGGESVSNFSLNGGLSYELDLWNRIAAGYDVAKLEAEAVLADRSSAILSLIGTAADLYWQIGYLHQLIDSQTASLDYAEQSLAISRARFAAGAVARSELLSQQQALLDRQESLAQTSQSLTEARNAFAILFDGASVPEGAEPNSLEGKILPVVKSGLPADLLRNRPDLYAAELRLRKAHREIAVTVRSYYPTFTLTGSLGSSSSQLQQVLQNPVAALGAGLALPFLQWDQTRLQVQIVKSDYGEAVSAFRQTLLTALSEVENALSAQSYYRNQNQRALQILELREQAEQLAESRYLAGAEGRQDWLDAREQVRAAQRDFAEIRLHQLQNRMELYQTLGGGDGFLQAAELSGGGLLQNSNKYLRNRSRQAEEELARVTERQTDADSGP